MRYYDYEIFPPGTKVNELEGWELYTEFEGQEIHRRSTSWNYKYKYGVEWVRKPLYYNVATGASVTGFARAHLLDAAHKVGIENVIYCDTDSLIMHDCDVSGLDIGPELGQWEVEGEYIVGHFAGKKLYGLKFNELNKEGKNKMKIASKGSKLEFDHIYKIVNGETVEWKNEAPSFSIANGINFVVRNISRTA